jgi:tetratricopeptide (TPR) repeat protein
VPRPAPAEPSARGPLVGRERSLATLIDAWQAARAGRPRVVLVEGDAGIGKSRLLAEFCRRAYADGATVLQGRSSEDLLAPYQPFVEALRHYLAAGAGPAREDPLGARRALLAQRLPELGGRSHRSDGPSSRGESGSERYALFDAVASLLREAARMRPTVLVLDDLHWADAATMLLARHVAASADDAPLLLLGAYRGVERGEALAAALADFRRARRLTSVSLAGLSAVEVAALAHGQGSRLGEDALRAVAERTGGNPFFAEEVVRQLEADGSSAVPESVKDLLGRRMRGLHESVCGALAAAAVLGGEFEFAVLQRATEVEPEALLDALDCALAEHVITEPPGRAGRYAFAHALIRETIYDELSRGRRARLHARAGAAIRALHAGSLEERAAELAHHFQRAGDDVAGFEFARLAGRAAARVHASDVAIGHYSAALEAAARLGLSAHEDERVRGLLIERGWRRHVHGDFEAAIADYGRALDAARAAGDRRLEAEALDQIGYAEKLFDIERAREHHRAALAIADELQDVPLQVGILSRLSLVLSNQLDLAGALAVGERALALARDGGGKADRGPAIDALKQAALQLGDLDRLGRLTAELEEAERASGDLWYLQWTLLEAAFVPLGRARYEEAAARLDDALAISRRIGDSTARPLIHDARCWLERSRGRYDRALAEGRRAVELSAPGGGGPWSAWTRATLGWCLLEVRAVSEAISVLEQGHGHAELLADRYRTAAHLAWARTLAGDRDGALDAIAAAARARDALTVPAGSAYLFGFGATVALARAQLASGAADDALAAIEPLPSVAREAGWHEAEAAASLAIGLCHADRDVDRAGRALREAVALARRHALPGVEWEAIGALAALAGGAEATELRAQSAAIAGRLAAGIDDDGLAAGLAQVSQR